MDSDIKVKEIRLKFQKEPFRFPLKFGTVVMEEMVYCYSQVVVENRKGKVATGWGSMPLGILWAFPSSSVSYEKKEEAMKEVSLRFARLVESYPLFSHPVDIFWEVEEDLKRIAKEVSREMKLEEELPFLASLVSASPIDASLHDAFGKVNQISSYQGYGKEFMNHDLSLYLGKRYRGKYIGDYLRKEYLKELPVFHLVGGLDRLRRKEVNSYPEDGLPYSLEEWVEKDGLDSLKIKLTGKDLSWDISRILEVSRIAREVRKKKGWKDSLFLSLDTNEQCESPEYMIELLKKIREKEARVFEEILYIEQPTGRDLEKYSFNMKNLSSLKPVLMDESLTGVKEMDKAVELGWSGIALKTCKCHSSCLLLVCRAEEERMIYTVQDLTLYGISLVHSVGFSARINTLRGVESNGIQYHSPDSFLKEKKIHPGIMFRKEGKVNTYSIRGYGLGFQIEKILE